MNYFDILPSILSIMPGIDFLGYTSDMLLYIHIPFCDSKCSYCSFNSYVDKFHLKEAYMKALARQLEYEFERFDVQPGSLETVFIGGGTPSTVPPELYVPLFERIRPYLKSEAEITSEANPNSATSAWLKGMYDLGVNRISFGVQSFNNDKLKMLARAHKADDAIQAVNNAEKAGFKHLSIDLIYATYLDNRSLLAHDLQTAFTLPIDHLSAYALTIEEGTPLQSRPETAMEQLETTQWFFEQIHSHGFKQYEISNFGNYHSQHNLGYWKYRDYIGLGSGAVGFLKDRRFYPSSNVESYIDTPLFHTEESLDHDAIMTEKLFLGLRSIVGVEHSQLSPKQREQADLLVREQKLIFNDGRYFNSDYLLSDELALFILQ